MLPAPGGDRVPAPDQLLEGVAVGVGQLDVVALAHGRLRKVRDTATVVCSHAARFGPQDGGEAPRMKVATRPSG